MAGDHKIQLFELTRQILEKIPPAQRFSAQDAALFAAHRDLLCGLEDELVQGFYDTIDSHAPMHAVISHGARSERENTLRHWWQRTTRGEFDDQYWAWQALIGLAHIKSGVKNQMMLVMWNWTTAWLRQRLAHTDTPAGLQAAQLVESFERLALTAQCLTAESYTENYLETVTRITGFKPALLQRMASTEIDRLLAEARQELGLVQTGAAVPA
ncbi:MAG: protoglobin domain-containing protein [Leptothrix sp. (in: b-proteobacteria)]